MSYETIARKIPDRIRSERLLIAADPIANAQPTAGNKHMDTLYAIWYEFIEPFGNGDRGCPTCLQRLIDNYREMKAMLVKLEWEYNLIKSLQPK